jgi:hypothetical protein
VTLMRDHLGFGFSIAGGKGAESYEEGSDCVFISKVDEGRPAARDGKLQVGDKIVLVIHILMITNGSDPKEVHLYFIDK